MFHGGFYIGLTENDLAYQNVLTRATPGTTNPCKSGLWDVLHAVLHLYILMHGKCVCVNLALFGKVYILYICIYYLYIYRTGNFHLRRVYMYANMILKSQNV